MNSKSTKIVQPWAERLKRKPEIELLIPPKRIGENEDQVSMTAQSYIQFLLDSFEDIQIRFMA